MENEIDYSMMHKLMKLLKNLMDSQEDIQRFGLAEKERAIQMYWDSCKLPRKKKKKIRKQSIIDYRIGCFLSNSFN